MNVLPRLKVSAVLVDARGMACPAPIIALAKALRASEEVELWADDPAAHADLLAFCEASGHPLVQCAAPGQGGPVLQAVVRHAR